VEGAILNLQGKTGSHCEKGFGHPKYPRKDVPRGGIVYWEKSLGKELSQTGEEEIEKQGKTGGGRLSSVLL